MAAVSQKSKKPRNKPPKSRPPATSSLSQPIVEDAWSSTVLSAFSPGAELFAFLSLAVDKHRLRVFDVRASQAIAEYVVDRARVTSLAWIPFKVSEPKNVTKDAENTPSKKRKKVEKVTGTSANASASRGDAQAVALGLSDGSVQIFSVAHGRIVRTLVHPTGTSPVLAISKGCHGGKSESMWTSSADGVLRLWDLRKGEILVTTQSEGRTPYSALALRPGVEDEQSQVAAAGSTIHILAVPSDTSASDASDADSTKEICSFSGHASAVKSLLWNASTLPAGRLFSSAEDDRFVYIWETPDLTTKKGRMAASCPLDTNVHQIDVTSSGEKQVLLTLSSSGKITLSPVPAELSTSAATKSSAKQQVPTLLPRSTITLSAKKSSSDVHVIAAVLLRNEEGRIRTALLSGGAKVGFETLDYLDGSGEFISEINLQPKSATLGLVKEVNEAMIANHRYVEGASVAVATGEQTPHDPASDAVFEREIEGALDVDLAELSLGQRLAARSGDIAAAIGQHSSDSDAEGQNVTAATSLKKKPKKKTRLVAVPAHSLTRTLIQALHSSDTGLLEACLVHSDETLVRNTIASLPSQLAVSLLTACVDRLARGGRGNNMKGRGAGASAQRGMTLIKWVKATLIFHSGHLMTMPDLVARLSNLHSTLTTRLMLQERLLTLSGRLELVLAQVELRSLAAPAPLPYHKKRNKLAGRPKKEPTTYVEGESSETEDKEQMEVEIEGDEHDVGSIEDVELGADSDEEDEEDEEGEEDDDSEDIDEDDDNTDDDDDDDTGNIVNGFIDEEAEDYEDDESDEDSE